MIKITKTNMMDLMKECFNIYKQNMYCRECFSSSEIRIEENLKMDISTILNAIKEKGININKHFGHLFKEYELAISKEDNVNEEPCDFETYVYCPNMEHFLDSKWVNTDLVIKKETEFYTELEIGSPRYKYQKWHISKESIEALLKESLVANQFIDILNEISTKRYNYNGEKLAISSMEIIRDMSALNIKECKNNEVSDCSMFLIELYHESVPNDIRITLLVKAGGFYEDIIIAKKYSNGNYIIRKVIPLQDVNPLSIREYSPNLLESFLKYLKQFENYREKLCKAN